MFLIILSFRPVFDRPKRTLYSKKYGVDLIRYTHAANTVVYSSNKIDGTLKRIFSFYYSNADFLASPCVVTEVANQWTDPVVNLWKDTTLSFLCDVCSGCAAHQELKSSSCWIVRHRCSLWTEVVVCTVWGSVILPHTGANCTSDCLAHGGVVSSHPLAVNVMTFAVSVWG